MDDQTEFAAFELVAEIAVGFIVWPITTRCLNGRNIFTSFRLQSPFKDWRGTSILF